MKSNEESRKAGEEDMTEQMDFISQIPAGVLQKTEIKTGRNIVLFKPMVYMGGVTFHVTDYHIVIPSEHTPAARLNNELVYANQRRILAVNPGDTVTCFQTAPAKPYYSFLIKPKLLRQIAEEMEFAGEIRFRDFLNPFSAELFQACQNLERESTRPDRLDLMLDSMEVQIAASLLRGFQTNMNVHPMLFQDVDAYVRLAAEYIRTYFSSNLTLKDICEEVHVSPYHFIRMFKKKTGMTPHRYLLAVRMEKAKELLRTRRYSVAETAMLCGFESIPHFSMQFKKATGRSPAEYRSGCS